MARLPHAVTIKNRTLGGKDGDELFYLREVPHVPDRNLILTLRDRKESTG